MRILFHEKLSPHKYKTAEGYLVCMDAILARTGKQEYYRKELFPDSANGDEVIEVDRKPEQVFAKETIASFENKPLTCEHPTEDVIPLNYKDYSVGFVRDVHKGTFEGKDVLIGNLFVTDPDCIDDIENGVRTDLSCGYNCDITDGDNPEQINIRGNHVALCECGRAGCAKIVDSRQLTSYEERLENMPVNARMELEKAQNKHKALVGIYHETQDIVSSFPEPKRKEAAEKANKTLAMLAKAYNIREDFTVHDALLKMPQSDKTKLSRYLGTISSFVKDDPDISQIVRRIEASINIEGNPIKLIRESIDGWKKMDDGMMRKDYVFSVDGYNNHIRISLYADPEDYVVNEVSAYVLDSSCSEENTVVDDYNIVKKDGKFSVNVNGTEQSFDTETEARDYAKAEVEKAASMLRDRKIKNSKRIDLNDVAKIDVKAIVDSCKTKIEDEKTLSFKHNLRLAMEEARNKLEDMSSEVDEKECHQYARKAKKNALDVINRALRPDVFEH